MSDLSSLQMSVHACACAWARSLIPIVELAVLLGVFILFGTSVKVYSNGHHIPRARSENGTVSLRRPPSSRCAQGKLPEKRGGGGEIL